MSFVPGPAYTHAPTFLRLARLCRRRAKPFPEQQAAYPGRLCEHVRQLVEAVVNRLGIRLGPAEALEDVRGDELDHQRRGARWQPDEMYRDNPVVPHQQHGE